jgi:formate-dependent nitrite reductase membrane component NrfD
MLAVAIQAARDGLLGKWWGARLIAMMPQKLLAIPGAVMATFVGGYTSVLLSATSIAVWNRSRMLGVVFVASAFSSGTALTSLVLRIVGAPASALHKLEKFEWFCMLVEIVGLLGFLHQTGRASKALVGIGPEEKGRTFWPFMFGGGLVLPWLLTSIALWTGKKKHHKSNGTRRGGFGMLVALIALIGGYFLRKTVVEAGPVSGDDARTSLWNARR